MPPEGPPNKDPSRLAPVRITLQQRPRDGGDEEGDAVPVNEPVLVTSTGRRRVMGVSRNPVLALDGDDGGDLELEEPEADAPPQSVPAPEPVVADTTAAHHPDALLAAGVLEPCQESEKRLSDEAKRHLVVHVIAHLEREGVLLPGCHIAKIYVSFLQSRSVNLATNWARFRVRVAVDQDETSATRFYELDHDEVRYRQVTQDDVAGLDAMLFRARDPHGVRVRGEVAPRFPVDDPDQRRYSLQYALLYLEHSRLSLNIVPASDIVLDLSSYTTVPVAGGNLHVFRGQLSVCTKERDWCSFPYLYGFVEAAPSA